MYLMCPTENFDRDNVITDTNCQSSIKFDPKILFSCIKHFNINIRKEKETLHSLRLIPTFLNVITYKLYDKTFTMQLCISTLTNILQYRCKFVKVFYRAKICKSFASLKDLKFKYIISL